MELERIVSIGEKLGYTGEELRTFVKEERVKQEGLQREERARRRDEEKEERELEDKKLADKLALEERKLVDEKEKRELEKEKLAQQAELEKQRLEEEKAKREAEEKRLADKLALDERKLAQQAEEERRERELEEKKLELEERKLAQQAEWEKQKLENEKEANEKRLELERNRIQAEQEMQERKHQHEIAAREQGNRARLPKLATFVEGKDELDAYLDRYEKYAEMARWPREDWAMGLGSLLSGQALSVYSRVARTDAGDYTALKKALLDRYQLDAEGFRKKLRESLATDGERPEQFIERLKGYLYKWIEMAGAKQKFDDLVFLMLAEQFVSKCSNNLAVYLKTVTFKNLDELGEIAHKFLGARGMQMKDITRPKVSDDMSEARMTCWGCGKVGHRQRECKNQSEVKAVPRAGVSSTVKCFSCGKLGHYASDCRESKKREYKGGAAEVEIAEERGGGCVMVREDKIGSGWEVGDMNRGKKLAEELCLSLRELNAEDPEVEVREGIANGYRVKTIRDTGCTTVVVRRALVGNEQFTGERRTCVLLNGMRTVEPMAKIVIDTPYLKGEVEAMCMENPLDDLTIGNVRGARRPDDPDPQWTARTAAAETRTQAGKKESSPAKTSGSQKEVVRAGALRMLPRGDRERDKARNGGDTKETRGDRSWFTDHMQLLKKFIRKEEPEKAKGEQRKVDERDDERTTDRKGQEKEEEGKETQGDAEVGGRDEETRKVASGKEVITEVERGAEITMIQGDKVQSRLEEGRQSREANLRVGPPKGQVDVGSVRDVGHEANQGETGLPDGNGNKVGRAQMPQTKIPVRSGRPQEDAFQMLKRKSAEKQILRPVDTQREFVRRTDAADSGRDAVRLREHEGMIFPVAFASEKSRARENAYAKDSRTIESRGGRFLANR
jgi:hypothetical protein